MVVYAPDCLKDVDVYQSFVNEVTKVLWKDDEQGQDIPNHMWPERRARVAMYR